MKERYHVLHKVTEGVAGLSQRNPHSQNKAGCHPPSNGSRVLWGWEEDRRGDPVFVNSVSG